MNKTDNLILTENNSQLQITVTHGNEILGYLVIDSLVNGRCCGGVRIMPDIDLQEMQILAHAMTLKLGFLGFPQGGAKAGVLGDPEMPEEKRRYCLAAFARAIEPFILSRIFEPSIDMGTNYVDIQEMLRSISARIERKTQQNPGYYTALSVFAGAKQAARYLGLNLADCKVAIEGFGNVGRSLAKVLDRAGVKIVAISTSRGSIHNPDGLNIKLLTSLSMTSGSQVVEFFHEAEHMAREKLLELPVDILFPCARHNCINEYNAGAIKAQIVCAGANRPVAPEVIQLLHKDAILYLPYFVTNCGGILGGTMEFAGIKSQAIEAFIDHFVGRSCGHFLRRAAEEGIPVSDFAEAYTRRQIAAKQNKWTRPKLSTRLLQFGLHVYHNGWIPSSLVGILSPYYFQRMLSDDFLE